jgi:catechol 2,3-dioxygenase-like lactoylglutathione lyase family enzyme
MPTPLRLLPLLIVALIGATVPQQPGAAPQRPRILGLAHVAFFVSDLDKARAFYRGLLGFDEPFTLPVRENGRDKAGSVDIAFVKINDRQWIELFNRPPAGDPAAGASGAQAEGQLNHIALYTDSADRMRDYLASRGVSVPAAVPTGRTGNKNFTVKDPDGHTVEIVEYLANSWTGADTGRHMPAQRLSSRAMHVGILSGRLDRSLAFYGGILGFEEFWRGNAATSTTLSWVNIRVPDGTDYIELMLYDELPAPANRGSAHHLCLEVADVEQALAAFDRRPLRSSYTRPVAIRTGVNRKRQLNLFDPDGTRVELMEPGTVDGKPAPSSLLPPPR